MPLDADTPPEYLVGHLEDALARDERVCEQGLHIDVDAEARALTVRGMVSTAERQQRIPDVVGELLPGFVITNATTVSEFPEDPSMERVEDAL